MPEPRADLATAITAAIVDLPPAGLDGETIVGRLCADKKGRDALRALGRELANEQIREAARLFIDAFVAAAPEPVEPEVES